MVRGLRRDRGLVLELALPDREHGPLWIAQAADPAGWELDRAEELRSAKLGAALERRIQRFDGEVGHPVRRYPGLLLLRRERPDPPVAPLADADDVVRRSVAHPHLLASPAEELAIEAEDRAGVAGRQLVPGERAGLVDPGGAGVRAGLPHGEDGSGRIAKHRHPADVEDVERPRGHVTATRSPCSSTRRRSPR